VTTSDGIFAKGTKILDSAS